MSLGATANGSSVARRRAEDAQRQHFQKLHQPLQPQYQFPPLLFQPETHTIVPLEFLLNGHAPSASGAAGFTTKVALTDRRLFLLFLLDHQWTHTIVQMDMPTGKPDGLLGKKRGVVRITAKHARIPQVVNNPRLMIVRQATETG